MVNIVIMLIMATGLMMMVTIISKKSLYLGPGLPGRLCLSGHRPLQLDREPSILAGVEKMVIVAIRDGSRYQTAFDPLPLIFGKLYCNFSENVRRMPIVKVQNTQYRFLDWKCPPALLWNFSEIHPIW